MNWLLRRCKEPSTWRGIFVLAGLFGYSLDPELQNQLIISVTALIAAIEIFRAEKKPELPPIELQAKPESDPVTPVSTRLGDPRLINVMRESVPTRRQDDSKPDSSDITGWGG